MSVRRHQFPYVSEQVNRNECPFFAVFRRLRNAAAPQNEVWRRCFMERRARQSRSTEEGDGGGLSPAPRSFTSPPVTRLPRGPPAPDGRSAFSRGFASRWATLPRSAARTSCAISLRNATIGSKGQKVGRVYDLCAHPHSQGTSCWLISSFHSHDAILFAGIRPPPELRSRTCDSLRLPSFLERSPYISKLSLEIETHFRT